MGKSAAEPLRLNLALDHRVVGEVITIACVKYRGGKRHRVLLHLRWQAKWGEWLLTRYEEFPELD
jgi:hypothetical protein